jgi:hypothetical protein
MSKQRRFILIRMPQQLKTVLLLPRMMLDFAAGEVAKGLVGKALQQAFFNANSSNLCFVAAAEST